MEVEASPQIAVWHPEPTPLPDELIRRRNLKRRTMVTTGVACTAAIFVSLGFQPTLGFNPAFIIMPLFVVFASVRLKKQWANLTPDGLPVQAIFRDQRGKFLGQTTGGVMASDGWLMFEGQTCRFALTRIDAVYSRKANGGYIKCDAGPSVQLIPLVTEGEAFELDRVMRDWTRAEVPKGESILPPTDAHPQVHQAAMRGTAFMAACGLILAASLASIGLNGWAFAAACLIGALLVLPRQWKRFKSSQSALDQLEPLPQGRSLSSP